MTEESTYAWGKRGVVGSSDRPRTCFPSRLSRVRVPSPAPSPIPPEHTQRCDNCDILWCRYPRCHVDDDHVVHGEVHEIPETGVE
jgi:hypothetical protein